MSPAEDPVAAFLADALIYTNQILFIGTMVEFRMECEHRLRMADIQLEHLKRLQEIAALGLPK